MMAKLLPLLPLALFFFWSSGQGRANAWISSTTSTSTTTTAVVLKHLDRHNNRKKQQQHFFRIQQPLLLTSTTSSETSSSSSSRSDPPTTSSSTASSPSLSSSSLSSLSPSPLEYDWKEQWYALTYASHVPNPSTSAEVVPAAVFGQPLVLWREQDDDSGEIYCATDKCPHRSTALSEGRVRNGTLTCLYHGWQFSGRQDGTCVKIPQLDTVNAIIPKRACLDMKTCRVQDGIVWVWMGDAHKPPTRSVPTNAIDGVFDEHGRALGDWVTYDFQ
jgi:nitrite reductase/ring-hydroxylating ferredoxin subunit